MEQALFTVCTRMEKEDYRKFLYTATFRRSPWGLIFITGLSLAVSLLLSWGSDGLRPVRLLILWGLYFCIAIGAVCLKIELKNRKRIATDRTGAFGAVNTLCFYEDRLTLSCEELHSFGEFRYSQFYGIMESKDFFLFYLSADQASMVRKKDLENPDAFRRFLASKFPGRFRSLCRTSR